MKRILYILALFICANGVAQLPVKVGNHIPVPEGEYSWRIDSTDISPSNWIYIDPSSPTNGIGTISDPKNTFSGINFQTGWRYSLKNGTEYTPDIYVDAPGVLFDVYGSSPTIAIVNKIRLLHNDITINYLHVKDWCDLGTGGSPITGYFLWKTRHEERITGWGGGWIIGAYIEKATDDGIFISNTAGRAGSTLEIAYCNIEGVNQSWYDTPLPANASPGDCIQLQKIENTHIHHCILDKSETGNKFCIIVGDVDTKETSAQLYSVIEWNIMKGPKNTSGGGGSLFLADGTNNIVRNNRISGDDYNTYAISCSNENPYGVSQNNYIYGNIVFSHSADVKIWTSPSDIVCDIYNNTFRTVETFASSWNSKNYLIRNNILKSPVSGIHSSNLSIDSEGLYNLFEDPDNNDYAAKETSPAVDNGVHESWMSDYVKDIFEVAVPQNSISKDIGGSQYGTATITFCDTSDLASSAATTDDENNLGNGAIDHTTTGGVAPYSYLWSNGATSEDLTNLIAGFYTLTITDDSNCVVQKVYEVKNTWTNVLNQLEPDTVYVSDEALPDGLGIHLTDNNVETVWSSQTVEPTADIVFDQIYTFSSISLAGNKDEERTSTVGISVSNDSTNWSQEILYTTTQGGDLIEYITLNISGKYIRLRGYANSSGNGWNAWLDFKAFGLAGASTAGDSLWINFSNDAETDWPITINPTTDNGTTGKYSVSYSNYDGSIVSGTANGVYLDDVATTTTYGSTADDSLSVTVEGIETNYVSVNFSAARSNASPGERSQFVELEHQRIDTVDAGQSAVVHYYDSVEVSDDGILNFTIIENNSSNFCYLSGIQIKELPDIIPCSATTINVSGIVTDVSCFNLTDGAIDASVSGGTSSYTYSWNTGESTQDLTGLQLGTYTLTATDGNGCVGIKSFEVTQPEELDVTNQYNKSLSCYGGNDRSITVIPNGGTAPYNINWTSIGVNETAVDSSRIDTLRGVYYPLQITDANGCSFAYGIGGVSPAPLVINDSLSVVEHVTDEGADGSITPYISGGTLPHTYLWSNTSTTKDIDNLPAGTYTLTVTDDNGCSTEHSFNVRIAGTVQIIYNRDATGRAVYFIGEDGKRYVLSETEIP